jgi:hypothetical protein
MQGINFKEPLFHKVVSGEKTQTRRVINPQPDFISENFHWAKKNNGDVILPRYSVGEKLYLKEPYNRSYIPEIGDKYDNPFQEAGDPKCWETIYQYDKYIYAGAEWKNKLFMPAKYARYFIEITGVRAERLQDISDEDCIKEGIIKIDSLSTRKCYTLPESSNYAEFYTPQQAYAALIDSISGKGTWEMNPFVWTYDFKLTN